MGFDGADNLSGTQLWRAGTNTFFIGVPNQTDPQAVLFEVEMTVDLLGEAPPLFR